MKRGCDPLLPVIYSLTHSSIIHSLIQLRVRHGLRTGHRSRGKTSSSPGRARFSSALPRSSPCPTPNPLPIVAPSALEAGVLPQTCLETFQSLETFLTPTFPFRAPKVTKTRDVCSGNLGPLLVLFQTQRGDLVGHGGPEHHL